MPANCPATGSGLTSMTTDEDALNCLGRSRLTTSVVPTVSRNTITATHQRARRMEMN